VRRRSVRRAAGPSGGAGQPASASAQQGRQQATASSFTPRQAAQFALQFAGTVARSSKLASASISMTRVSNAISFGLPSYGLFAESRFISQSYRNFPRRSSYKYLRIRAVQGNDGRRSLVDIIRIIPELSRNYFRSRSRRTLFGGISLLGGFYVAQTISLSFGVLAVNDVIAAVVCVLLTEYVTKFYYSRPKVTFPIALLNNFKMGFTYGLFIDAFKLAS